MQKLRQEILLRNIFQLNNNGAGEKSYNSTDARRHWKLGCHSAYAPERGRTPPAAPSHHFLVSMLYERSQDLEWQVPRKTKKLMRIV